LNGLRTHKGRLLHLREDLPGKVLKTKGEGQERMRSPAKLELKENAARYNPINQELTVKTQWNRRTVFQ